MIHMLLSFEEHIVAMMYVCCLFFLKFFWVGHIHTSYFGATGRLYPCFGFLVTSSLGFKSQSGFCLICIAEANVIYIPWDPPLVLHIANFLMNSIVGHQPGSHLAQGYYCVAAVSVEPAINRSWVLRVNHSAIASWLQWCMFVQKGVPNKEHLPSRVLGIGGTIIFTKYAKLFCLVGKSQQ